MKDRELTPFLRIFQDSRDQWPGLVAVLIFTLLAGVFKSASALYWGSAVDLGVAGNLGGMSQKAGLMLLFVLLDALRTAILYTIIGQTMEKMFFNFRMRAFNVLATGDVGTLEDTMRSGDIAMRINTDIEQLCDNFSNNFPNFARLIFQALFAIVCCIVLSWQLSLAYFFLLPLSLWIFKVISAPIEEQKKVMHHSTGRAMSIAADSILGLETIKSFNIEDEMDGRFAKAVDEAYEEGVKSEKISVRMVMIKYGVSITQTMSLFIIGFFLVSRGYISVGHVMSFVALSAYVTEAFEATDRMSRSLRQSKALAERLYEIYDIPLEQDGWDTQLRSHGDYINIRDLGFSYLEEKDLLEGITLSLKENQKIGLIGPSGCGKSTIIKLICRFYNPTSGGLELFGKPSINLSSDALRNEIALVTQDASLFEGSIYENVSYGRPDADEAEVIQAIKDANLWDFIEGLPEGVHTQVGELGSRLSGGQRQRVCIARAMLKDARLILLDEATSALDTQTESEIQEALDRLMVDRSAVIVAHRLTTIQNADYIYCLDNGSIIEEGTPTELLERKGYYYDTCIKQGLIPRKEGVVV